MAARFVPTGRLSNVIQMITLSRQSGILRAIRGQDAARQMGQIRFVNGQPASVLFGQMVGEHALNALMGWGECMYSFDESAAEEPDGDGYYSSSDADQYGQYGQYGAGNYSNPPSPPASSWPSYGYPPSNPNYAPSAPPHYPPNPASSPYPGYGSGYPPPTPGQGNTGYPGSQGNQGNQGYPGYSGGNASDANDPYYRQTPPQQGFTATSMPGAPAFRPEMLEAVPYQTGMSEPIEQLPLDRRERMILLLVNGQRSMLDLVRLTHRNEREIYSVLHHLALLGLIQFRR
jgi:hypothetical protein